MTSFRKIFTLYLAITMGILTIPNITVAIPENHAEPLEILNLPDEDDNESFYITFLRTLRTIATIPEDNLGEELLNDFNFFLDQNPEYAEKIFLLNGRQVIPLIYAILMKNFYLVERLLPFTEVDLETDDFENPLYLIARMTPMNHDDRDFIDTVLNHIIDVGRPVPNIEMENIDGDTILMVALEADNIPAVIRLTDRGASYTAQNGNGVSALDVAHELLVNNPNHEAALAFMELYQADLREAQ